MTSTSEGTNVLDRASSIFGIINNTILSAILGYQLYRSYFGKTLSKKEKTIQKRIKSSKRYQILHALSLISMIVSVLFCVIRGIIAWDGWSDDCTGSTGTAVSFWQITKSALYLYFVIRFEVAFKESTYALSKCTLIGFYIAIFIQWLLAEILIIGFWHGERSPPITGQCVGLPPIFIIIFFSIWDVICTIGLSLLFSVKLCQVHKSMTSNYGDHEQEERVQSYDFIATVIKVLILSIFASITTILCTFGVARSGITTFIITDTMINCWCIFLMYSNNSKMFNICCCGLCSQCCLRCFLKKEAIRLGITVNDVIMSSPKLRNQKTISWGSKGSKNNSKLSARSQSEINTTDIEDAGSSTNRTDIISSEQTNDINSSEQTNDINS